MFRRAVFQLIGLFPFLFGLGPLAVACRTEGASPIRFTFTLDRELRTSAGIFLPDGTLVRTIWSGVSYQSGTHIGTWDGLDDWGNLVSDGSYQVRVLANDCKYVWEGVVGNTSTARTGPTVWNGYNTIGGLAIAGTKTYYANGYPEGGSTSGVFLTADPNGSKRRLLAERNGGNVWLVATDGVYAYWAGRDRGATPAERVRFVFAVRVADDEEVDFPAGSSYTIRNGPTYLSVLDKRTDDSEATGLAVQRKGSLLFVAHADKNEIVVLDKAGGAPVRTITEIKSPGALAIDADDHLWVVRKPGAAYEVAEYAVAADGAIKQLQAITTGFDTPMALAVSPDNETLVVVDGGGSQQLKAFSTATGRPTWTLGQLGGYAKSTEVTDDRFMFGEHASVAFQSDGSFWLCDYGNGRIQHFTADRKFIDRIQFRKSSYFCSVDPNNPTRVFSDYLEFAIDYSLPLRPNNASWKLVRNWEHQIPAGFGSPYRKLCPCTLSNGRTYALVDKAAVPGTKAEELAMFELTVDGRLRDTGLVVPTAYASLQPDGSIRAVNKPSLPKEPPVAGTVVWTIARLTGFDAQGNPKYARPTTLASRSFTGTDPVWWSGANKLRAGVQTTGGIVVSFDPGLPDEEGRISSGYHLGGVRAGDDKWLWRTSMSTHGDYIGQWPEDGAFDLGNRVQYAGSVAMTMDRHIFYGYHGEFYKGSQVNKFRHYYENGLYVGEFGEVGANVGYGGLNSPAKMAGNVHNPWLAKTADGRVFLYHNDEGWHGGVHRWRLDGLDTVTEQVADFEWKAPVVAGLRGEYFDAPDCNNAYVKTVRADREVKFTWGAEIPADTALTTPKDYSVRWTGFIAPPHTETYTFYAQTDGGVRLWVNDRLILEQDVGGGREAVGTIGLQAGQRYALKLEYRRAVGGGRVNLAWSSPRLPKHVIPQAALCWAPWLSAPSPDGALDLLAGLPLNGSLAEARYGFNRSTGDDSPTAADRWIVRSGSHSYRTARNGKTDLSVHFQTKAKAECYVMRDLGPAADLIRWSLDGEISFEGTYFNDGDAGGQYVEVLDDADRVIARLNPRIVTYPTDYRVTGNTADLWQTDGETLKTGGALRPWRQLSISAGEGRVTFTFGDHPPAVTEVLDPAANWRRPKSIRLLFWSNGKRDGEHTRKLAVRNLAFFKYPNEPAPAAAEEMSQPATHSLALSPVEPPAPLPPELAALRDQFLRYHAERVAAPFDAELQRLNADYAAGLDRLLSGVQTKSKGTPKTDADALRAERERIADSQPVPTTDEADTPTVLRSARAAYRAAYAKLAAARAANLKRVAASFSARLTQLEADYTKAGLEVEAKAVREFRESSSNGR